MPTTTVDTAQTSASSLQPVNLLKEEIDQMAKIYDLIIDFFANYTFQLIGAFIIFIFGYYIAGKIANGVLRLCEKQKLDITLSHFLANTSKPLNDKRALLTIKSPETFKDFFVS